MPAGGSLNVWFTPPRAGTFIYHTHAHDVHQLSSGMYSALLVVPDRKTFDAEVERVVLLGGIRAPLHRLQSGALRNQPQHQSAADDAEGRHEVRFRLINISPNFNGVVSLRGANGPVKWRAVAKDGADLPPSQATARPAKQPISVGETYDFEFAPTTPVNLRLEVRARGTGTS